MKAYYLLTAVSLVLNTSVDAAANERQYFMKGKSNNCLSVQGPLFSELKMASCEVAPNYLVNLGPNGRNIIFKMLGSDTVRCAHVAMPVEFNELPKTVTTDNCGDLTFWTRAGVLPLPNSGDKSAKSQFLLDKDSSNQITPALCLEEVPEHLEETLEEFTIAVKNCDDTKPEQNWNLVEAVVP